MGPRSLPISGGTTNNVCIKITNRDLIQLCSNQDVFSRRCLFNGKIWNLYLWKTCCCGIWSYDTWDYTQEECTHRTKKTIKNVVETSNIWIGSTIQTVNINVFCWHLIQSVSKSSAREHGRILWKLTMLTIESIYQCLSNALPHFRREQKDMKQRKC